MGREVHVDDNSEVTVLPHNTRENWGTPDSKITSVWIQVQSVTGHPSFNSNDDITLRSRELCRVLRLDAVTDL